MPITTSIKHQTAEMKRRTAPEGLAALNPLGTSSICLRMLASWELLAALCLYQTVAQEMNHSCRLEQQHA